MWNLNMLAPTPLKVRKIPLVRALCCSGTIRHLWHKRDGISNMWISDLEVSRLIVLRLYYMLYYSPWPACCQDCWPLTPRYFGPWRRGEREGSRASSRPGLLSGRTCWHRAGGTLGVPGAQSHHHHTSLSHKVVILEISRSEREGNRDCPAKCESYHMYLCLQYVGWLSWLHICNYVVIVVWSPSVFGLRATLSIGTLNKNRLLESWESSFY